MPAADGNLFRRAFELAYFIHPHTQLALSVAESALHKLEHSFGRQGRRAVYVPAGRRQDRDSPSLALRTKINLKEEHLLQVLVYAESESWERSSEQGAGSYPVTEEDMVVRFIKHLVQITLKRNSFYVTLGLGRLLYEYETSQVRQMYDVLMQDHARFRDNSYFRRQKNLLMRELLKRFDQMIRMVRTAQREDRFQSQPTTEPLLRLVSECLVRFTPWETVCVFPPDFDPVGRIPGLSFSGPGPDDESPVEMNRIHTIIDPKCFSRLATSLGFPGPDEQLTVPQFFFSEDNQPRGDRFNPPPVPESQEIRIERSLADRARRRKAYRVGQMRVYVDGIESVLFEARRETAAKLKIPSTANVIEVRGQDAEGELPLATLTMMVPEISSGGSLIDSLTLEGGQELSIALRPVAIAENEIEEFEVEIRYTETQPLRTLSSLLRRMWSGLTGGAATVSHPGVTPPTPVYSWVIAAGLALAVVTLFILFLQRSSPQIEAPGTHVEVVPTPAPQVSPESTPIKSPERPHPPVTRNEIARVAWSRDPHAFDRAIRLAVRRGDSFAVEVSQPSAQILLAVNRADVDDQSYRRYRLTLSAAERSFWERTLVAPTRPADTPAHVLSLAFSTRQFPPADSYKLQVEGESQQGWENLGEIILKPSGR